MSRSVVQVFLGFVLLVGLTAGLLVRVRANYVLGKPGVKVIKEPIYNEDHNPISSESAFLPEQVAEYGSTNALVTKVEIGMLPPDTVYGRRIYRSGASNEFPIMASIVLMGTDRTSIHKPQYCLVGQGENIVSSEVITIPIAQPRPYQLKVMKLNTTSQHAIGKGKFLTTSGIYLYWFVADGQLTPHHGERMWLMGRDLIVKGLLQRWAYVSYFSRCMPGEENVLFERMKRFIAASVPEFQTTTGEKHFARAEILPESTPVAALSR